MEAMAFQKVAEDFNTAGLDGKIDIYVNTEGLTQAQYKELLRMFPIDELHRLEEALE
ncbi:MAG: hypothetical protein FWE91_10330 [Defluviitaleaceae bacterium]|nr:hypothetical protein [Defluviitaleaceae bacterium]MCL2837044.1 hypothetical protein [Defluviitaleaceae bacterium]